MSRGLRRSCDRCKKNRECKNMIAIRCQDNKFEHFERVEEQCEKMDRCKFKQRCEGADYKDQCIMNDYEYFTPKQKTRYEMIKDG